MGVIGRQWSVVSGQWSVAETSVHGIGFISSQTACGLRSLATCHSPLTTQWPAARCIAADNAFSSTRNLQTSCPFTQINGIRVPYSASRAAS